VNPGYKLRTTDRPQTK